jgi:hypothetical protein
VCPAAQRGPPGVLRQACRNGQPKIIQGLSEPVVLHADTTCNPVVHSTHGSPSQRAQLVATFWLAPRRVFGTHCTALPLY